eukprot:4587403-Prymnesium_polylepis.2
MSFRTYGFWICELSRYAICSIVSLKPWEMCYTYSYTVLRDGLLTTPRPRQILHDAREHATSTSPNTKQAFNIQFQTDRERRVPSSKWQLSIFFTKRSVRNSRTCEGTWRASTDLLVSNQRRLGRTHSMSCCVRPCSRTARAAESCARRHRQSISTAELRGRTDVLSGRNDFSR